MRRVTLIVWLVTALIGLIVVVLGIIAMIDPAGAQLANDADPFGEPPSRIKSLAMTLVGVGLVAWPLVLRRRGGDARANDTARATD